MRTAIGNDNGPCAWCGEDRPGLYWESRQQVLDFGVPTLPPLIETWDNAPVLCDECELKRREQPELEAG